MTDKPTPHKPMSRADWDATNEHARRVLHPARPTADELHRYAVAWGTASVADLTNWRTWEKRYNEALQIIYAMAIERDEMQAENERLRGLLQSYEDLKPIVRTFYLDGEPHQTTSTEMAMASILAVDGLDSHDHYIVAIQDGKPGRAYRQWDEWVPIAEQARFVSEYTGPTTNG